LGTKAETPWKPILTKELVEDCAILAVESAGTAAGHGSPRQMGKYGGDCHRGCNNAHIEEIPRAQLLYLGFGLRLVTEL
jgi:hypothetical protein